MMIEQTPHHIGSESAHRRFLRIGVDGLVVVLTLLNWIATQLVAAALHYPAFFMGRIIGHLYQPFAWWWWQYHWPHGAVRIGHSVIPLTRAWSLCDRIVFYPIIGLVILGAIISGLLLKSRGAADVHGSASWGDGATAREAEVLW